ncbi:MAG: hypothetical protein ACI9SC_002556, partial [Gammaproteobacteria bacterium]
QMARLVKGNWPAYPYQTKSMMTKSNWGQSNNSL